MINWNAVVFGTLAAVLVFAPAWVTFGFVASVSIVGTSGVVAGAVAGWVTNPDTGADWRAGGYHGMLAAGSAGILVVGAAAAVAFGGSSVVVDAPPGTRTTAASIVASPLGVPLFVLEGIAGGSAGGMVRFVLSNRNRISST